VHYLQHSGYPLLHSISTQLGQSVSSFEGRCSPCSTQGTNHNHRQPPKVQKCDYMLLYRYDHHGCHNSEGPCSCNRQYRIFSAGLLRRIFFSIFFPAPRSPPGPGRHKTAKPQIGSEVRTGQQPSRLRLRGHQPVLNLNKAGWRLPLRRQWVAMQPLRRPLRVVRIKNGGSVESARPPSLGPATRTVARTKCLQAVAGKRGALLSKREDPVVVVFDVHPARVPHDHMNRINRPTGPIDLTSSGP
jgi:hypothetical protein